MKKKIWVVTGILTGLIIVILGGSYGGYKFWKYKNPSIYVNSPQLWAGRLNHTYNSTRKFSNNQQFPSKVQVEYSLLGKKEIRVKTLGKKYQTIKTGILGMQIHGNALIVHPKENKEVFRLYFYSHKRAMIESATSEKELTNVKNSSNRLNSAFLRRTISALTNTVPQNSFWYVNSLVNRGNSVNDPVAMAFTQHQGNYETQPTIGKHGIEVLYYRKNRLKQVNYVFDDQNIKTKNGKIAIKAWKHDSGTGENSAKPQLFQFQPEVGKTSRSVPRLRYRQGVLVGTTTKEQNGIDDSDVAAAYGQTQYARQHTSQSMTNVDNQSQMSTSSQTKTTENQTMNSGKINQIIYPKKNELNHFQLSERKYLNDGRHPYFFNFDNMRDSGYAIDLSFSSSADAHLDGVLYAKSDVTQQGNTVTINGAVEQEADQKSKNIFTFVNAQTIKFEGALYQYKKMD